MKLLDDYFSLKQQLFDYFGYSEDWTVLPIDDSRGYYWRIIGGEKYGGSIGFARKEVLLDSEEGEYYKNEIYTNRFLPKWVYRGVDYTMICVDTHCDGNRFLKIFDNKLERPEK